MMTAEARSKTRETLFMVLSFQKPVSNDICRQTEYVTDRHHVTEAAKIALFVLERSIYNASAYLRSDILFDP
jgi:hypothetical protein